MKIFLTLLMTFLVSAFPIIELKGAIPLGIGIATSWGIQLNPWIYFIFAYIGSCIPVPFIILFLKPVLKYLGKKKLFRRMAEWLNKRFSKKKDKIDIKADQKAKEYMDKLDVDNITQEKKLILRQKKIEMAKYIALFIFVAIPLPLTGVWTGSGIAAFLNLNTKKALLAVTLGNLIAGLLIMAISLAGYSIAGISINLS